MRAVFVVLFLSICLFECKAMTTGNEDNNDEDYLVDDMYLSSNQIQHLYSDPSGRRHGLSDAISRWPVGIVPYVVSNEYSFTEKQIIFEGLRMIEDVSCVRFLEISEIDILGVTGKDFVYVSPGTGCDSYIGRIGGRQDVHLLQDGCLFFGKVIHEFMHVLGFLHMQTAVNRDSYVDIMWDNIDPIATGNFIHFKANTSMFGTDYDYDSITHYPKDSFTKNMGPTIVAKRPELANTMGQRDHLSKGDIERINRMYECYK